MSTTRLTWFAFSRIAWVPSPLIEVPPPAKLSGISLVSGSNTISSSCFPLAMRALSEDQQHPEISYINFVFLSYLIVCISFPLLFNLYAIFNPSILKLSPRARRSTNGKNHSHFVVLKKDLWGELKIALGVKVAPDTSLHLWRDLAKLQSLVPHCANYQCIPSRNIDLSLFRKSGISFID